MQARLSPSRNGGRTFHKFSKLVKCTRLPRMLGRGESLRGYYYLVKHFLG